MNILESFDDKSPAVIEPGFPGGPFDGFPSAAVCCFMQDTIDRLLPELCEVPDRPLLRLPGTGAAVWPVEYKDSPVAFCRLPVGAPAASIALEGLYAANVQTTIVFGTCGVLRADIEDCSVIIPGSALRCEGTSFHYAPAADEISLNSEHLEEFKRILEGLSLPYYEGKVWTTDAVYRETRALAAKRRQQGCLCVDMECSALAAVSQFRKRDHFQFFCAADNLDAPEWDPRSLGRAGRHERKVNMVRAALELAVSVSAVR